MVKATAEDIRHPLRRPGYTLLDVAAVVGGGYGAGTRLGAAGRAARAARVARRGPAKGVPPIGPRGPGPVREALFRPGYKGGSLLRKPIAREIPVKVQGKEVARVLEPDAPYLRPLRRGQVRRAGEAT